ncbi:hypothetical protein DSO57_1000055 [Entomophthora muscae]|uniref:Uncharacterized protein n=1 Tax=Entomophthora muscae TaxID=34485 RepID=A0ACC2SM58_9FUNG|nr:hypothetical protein DSO57_1000055 [Entomophthora muscae]
MLFSLPASPNMLPLVEPSPQQSTPLSSCTPWFLEDALLMAFNTYIFLVTPTLFLWTPV